MGRWRAEEAAPLACDSGALQCDMRWQVGLGLCQRDSGAHVKSVPKNVKNFSSPSSTDIGADFLAVVPLDFGRRPRPRGPSLGNDTLVVRVHARTAQSMARASCRWARLISQPMCGSSVRRRTAAAVCVCSVVLLELREHDSSRSTG